jgi:hypothetical protein
VAVVSVDFEMEMTSTQQSVQLLVIQLVSMTKGNWQKARPLVDH